jgi:hypothetical protein
MDNSTNDHEIIKQELIEFGSRWAEAMVANDADRIGGFMSDDWVIVSSRRRNNFFHLSGREP